MKKNLMIANMGESKIIELKTLKDFPFSKIVINDLRREAIKWVKEYGWRNPRVDVLVVFCNITEEDLK